VKIVASTRPGTPDSVEAGRARSLALRRSATARARAGDAGGGEGRRATELDDRNYNGRRVDFNVKDIDIKKPARCDRGDQQEEPSRGRTT